jgi:hypothetical protein
MRDACGDRCRCRFDGSCGDRMIAVSTHDVRALQESSYEAPLAVERRWVSFLSSTGVF